jgi:uncharacterized protein with FMN-binding domain
MRRPVLAAMTGVTALVVGLGIRSGTHTGSVTGLAAPVGIVSEQPAQPGTPEAATPSPSATATPAAGATSAQRRSTTHAPTKAAPSARARTTSPAPRRTQAPAVRVNGAAADTRYGPVQVQITVQNHRITRADAIEYPNGSGRDQEINSYAIPQLDDETLQAQSANIDSISGATYTSDGYISSLQSAIDQAHSAGLL